jgi:Kef-type K+ transport system membrane component KefB
MQRVVAYSFLLIAGMGLSQLPSLEPLRSMVSAATMIFLAYIMIQVGLEFDIDKSQLHKYGIDYLIAMAAAAVPWLCAAVYFWWCFDLGMSESLLVGRFASPTSAGILFAMLAAAGLASTWVYKKARVLAIFDDLDTVLLMIPLKMALIGFEPKLLVLIIVIVALLAASYFYMHWLRISTSNGWVAVYAFAVWAGCYGFDYVTESHLEVLLPAFALGCLIKSDHLHGSAEFAVEQPLLTDTRWAEMLDLGIKSGFMLLAGMALPPIQFGTLGWTIFPHVILLTVLTNIGKCVPLAAYGHESTFRERLALSLGMFPRGEVGIGVLLVSLDIFRQQNSLQLPAVQAAMAIGGLSLALNLLLTGVFILGVIRLLNSPGVNHARVR